jgi:dual specificity phosphatase 12
MIPSSLMYAYVQVTGVDIPHAFPQDFYPIFGMDIRGCVAHYKKALGRQVDRRQQA